MLARLHPKRSKTVRGHIKKSRYSSDKTPYGTSEEYLLFFMCVEKKLDVSSDTCGLCFSGVKKKAEIMMAMKARVAQW